MSINNDGTYMDKAKLKGTHTSLLHSPKKNSNFKLTSKAAEKHSLSTSS